METKRRGLHDIPSITNIGYRRQGRTQEEIFNDLVRLNWEKMRLCKEKRNFQEKLKRTDEHLSQIEKIEKLLREQMDMKDTEKIAPDVQEAKQTAGKEKRNEVIIKY